MSLACDKCGTTDFKVEGRAFALGFVCSHCRLVMCSACAGRIQVDGIPFICCYNCRSTDIHPADDWAEERFFGPSGLEPP